MTIITNPDRVSSYQVAAALRKAGHSAWKNGMPGFNIWSVRGDCPRVMLYGFPKQAERDQALGAYARILADAGFTTERHDNWLTVTGRKAQ